jgi:hypothetical protein
VGGTVNARTEGMATNSLFFVLPRSLLPLSGLCAPPEDSTGSPGTRDSRRGAMASIPAPLVEQLLV